MHLSQNWKLETFAVKATIQIFRNVDYYINLEMSKDILLVRLVKITGQATSLMWCFKAMKLVPHHLGKQHFVLCKIFKAGSYIYTARYVLSHLIDLFTDISGRNILKFSILEVLLCLITVETQANWWSRKFIALRRHIEDVACPEIFTRRTPNISLDIPKFI